MKRFTLLLALSAGLLVACSSSSDGTASNGAATNGTGDATTGTDGDPTAAHRLTFTTNDGTQVDYVLVVPPGRAVGVPGKVIWAFPPGGQDIDLAEQLVNEKYRAEALARDYVVFSPAAPKGALFYTDTSAALVPELLDMAATLFPPDGGRFDLVGVSNGGLSAFRAAIEHPERFRSLVVFPGYSPDGGDDPALSKLKGIGVAMFVGGNDSGWLESSTATSDALKAQGNKVELTVIAGQGHILGDALPGKELFDALERVRG
jgi:hypothetical protein